MIRARLTDPNGVTVEASMNDQGYLEPGVDVLTNLSGWTGGVGVRSTRTDRSGHGQFPAPTLRAGRTITLGLVAERGSGPGIAEWERSISGLFSDGGTGTLEVETDGVTLVSRVDLDGEVKPTINRTYEWGRVEIPLHAPDPYLYGAEQVTFLRAVTAGMGLEFPLCDPDLSFGAALLAADPIRNDGNAPSWDVYRIVGDFPGGARITADGRVVEWPWPITSGAPVEVRMSGSVWVGASNVTHMASVRQWWSVGPGGIQTPDFSPLQGGSGWCEVHHRDTYI